MENPIFVEIRDLYYLIKQMLTGTATVHLLLQA